MSLFQIAFRSIQQRGVASLLTMASMALGVMLVVAVLSIHGIIERSFQNNASLGYNMIVGAKGGREQLTLNTVYYLSAPVENIPYTYYLEFLSQEQRERELEHSLAVNSQSLLAEATELQSISVGGPNSSAARLTMDHLGLQALPSALESSQAPPVESGRNGKYAQMTELAIPLCLGDYYGRFRVVGTTPALFNDLVYDIENNRKFEFAQGRNFEHHSEEHGYFEAVVGSNVAREMEVKLGTEIAPAHGDPEGHTHARKFTVVGILKPSGTPNDNAVFVNMEGFFLMEDHAKPIEQAKPAEDEPQPVLSEEEEKKARTEKIRKEAELLHAADPDPLPVEQREVTAILLKSPPIIAIGLENAINEGKDAQAVTPVSVIYGLFEFFVDPIRWVLLGMTAMICVVSGISILVSIYNSMSERRQEIAVMRALGAGRETVMWIILLESTLLSLGGGLFGWLAGHTLGLAASPWIEERTGVWVGFYSIEPSIQFLQLFGMEGPWAEAVKVPLELLLIPALVLLAVIVGFWPAITAYRTDVARSLGK